VFIQWPSLGSLECSNYLRRRQGPRVFRANWNIAASRSSSTPTAPRRKDSRKAVTSSYFDGEHPEFRSWFVLTEENTRGHALTAMLALKVRRRRQSAWEPLNTTVEEGLDGLATLCVMELY
jgi:hypothetical protein